MFFGSEAFRRYGWLRLLRRITRRRNAYFSIVFFSIVLFVLALHVTVKFHLHHSIEHYPKERAKETDWKISYSALHEAITRGQQDSRFTISYGFQSGTADRISGLITIFFYSLLTNRALLLYEDSVEDLAKFEYAYDLPSTEFLLTRQSLGNEVEKQMNQMIYSHNLSSYLMLSNETEYFLMNQVNYRTPHSHEEFYVHSNILNATRAEYVIIASNRGLTYRMFENPYVKERLLRVGLRPSTAFRSMFDFLLTPNKRTMEYIKPYLEFLNEPALKIGIAIRVGDHLFQGDKERVDVNYYENFFSCAQVLCPTLNDCICAAT